MDYGDSVHKVLLRKIQKAEQDLLQLKLDYCRFIFGLTHRSRVKCNGRSYMVRSVDVDSMERLENGSFSRPAIYGAPAEGPDTAEAQSLGTDWTLEEESATGATIRS
ncbi:hypothetical protein QPM17_00200 [Marinobacter sp. TBZ242]|uniref:Uncharacterized protein n=1 Tax=Marinobacter azerbaijanicus TaxID=3050455 RepID=A0ABT7I653_9GAMM|nr:hypothetical protein [Marinobacter sp. TBZ242]MDL0429532.1 hypothetical protein [Marinobacter sp. TBZ242]